MYRAAVTRAALHVCGGGGLPALQALDSAEHIQVTCGVLLDDILDIIRTQRLLELTLGHKELEGPAYEEPQMGQHMLSIKLKSFKYSYYIHSLSKSAHPMLGQGAPESIA